MARDLLMMYAYRIETGVMLAQGEKDIFRERDRLMDA